MFLPYSSCRQYAKKKLALVAKLTILLFFSLMKLGPYTGQTFIITLPMGYSMHNIKWMSVWCDQANANFGYVEVPENLLVPVYVMMDSHAMTYHRTSFIFYHKAHDVRGNLHIISETQILLTEFTYDGTGPGLFFI